MESLHTRLRGAADLLSRYPYECWSYGESIGFEGLLAASRQLGDDRYAGFVHGSLKMWCARRLPFRSLDNTAPGHAMCLAFEDTHDEAIVAAAVDLSEHLRMRPTVRGAYASFERAPLRQPYSNEALDATGHRLLADPGRGVFVDCLHFDPPFFAHLGALTGDLALRDDGIEQALAYVNLLQHESGLFAHFFLEKTAECYGLGWSRGQGWALLGLLDVLEYCPETHPGFEVIVTSVRRLAEVVAAAQDTSGHWHALVGHDDLYLETSASLFFAAGFWRGVRRGWFSADLGAVAEKAWLAGLGELSDSGSLRGVSAAVWASTANSHYGSVPIGFQVPWGQGPLLVASTERALALGPDGGHA